MSTTIPTMSLNQLQQYFNSTTDTENPGFDQDGDGLLTRQEIADGILVLHDQDEDDAVNFFQALIAGTEGEDGNHVSLFPDFNNSGKVSSVELAQLAAASEDGDVNKIEQADFDVKFDLVTEETDEEVIEEEFEDLFNDDDLGQLIMMIMMMTLFSGGGGGFGGGGFFGFPPIPQGGNPFAQPPVAQPQHNPYAQVDQEMNGLMQYMNMFLGDIF